MRVHRFRYRGLAVVGLLENEVVTDSSRLHEMKWVSVYSALRDSFGAWRNRRRIIVLLCAGESLHGDLLLEGDPDTTEHESGRWVSEMLVVEESFRAFFEFN